MTVESKIEAILFVRGEPTQVDFLARTLGEDPEAVRSALSSLETALKGRGLSLVYKDDSVLLGTAPELSPTIEKMTKEELMGDLGKATLETLSIILYQGPIVKSRIDYIRGVNSSFILRNLLIRGLIERREHPEDKRTFLYSPTFDLLTHLGISRVEDLPEYGTARDEIRAFEEVFGETPPEGAVEDTPRDTQDNSQSS